MSKPNQPGLKGVHLLFITPLTKDYKLNEDAVREEVEWAVQNGLQGIWPGGFIGECTSLEEETRKRLYKIIAEQNKGRLYISANAHGLNPLQSIRLVNYAEELGYDSAWLSLPTPRRMTEDEIYNFYKMINDNTRLPFGLYNSPPIGIYIQPSLVARIAKLERLVSCKEAHDNATHIVNLYNECKDQIKEGFKILGVPFNFLPILMFGGVGVTSNNWDAATCLALYEAFQKGDYKKCIELQCALDASWPAILTGSPARQTYAAKISSSNIGVMKLRASLCMDIDMGPPMAQFAPATPEEAQRAKASLEKIPIKVKPLKR